MKNFSRPMPRTTVGPATPRNSGRLVERTPSETDAVRIREGIVVHHQHRRITGRDRRIYPPVASGRVAAVARVEKDRRPLVRRATWQLHGRRDTSGVGDVDVVDLSLNASTHCEVGSRLDSVGITRRDRAADFLAFSPALSAGLSSAVVIEPEQATETAGWQNRLFSTQSPPLSSADPLYRRASALRSIACS